MRKIRLAGLLAVGVLAAGCASTSSASTPGVDLAGTYQSCIELHYHELGNGKFAENTLKAWIKMPDDHTIVGSSGADQIYLHTVGCMLGELNAQSVADKLGMTTTMSGVQSETENGIDYTWSLQPGPISGLWLDITIREQT